MTVQAFDFGSGLLSDAMVARLAAQPGVQRVPSPKLTLFLRRDFLDPPPVPH